MPKRSGLMRMASRPHAQDLSKSSDPKIGKKKKKSKGLIKQPTAIAATAAKAAVVAAASSDDMFAMALPSMSVKATKKKREVEMVEHVPAFEGNNEKEDLFRRVLEAAKGSTHYKALIPADEHRAHMDELKRKKAERRAMKAERFRLHQKC